MVHHSFQRALMRYQTLCATLRTTSSSFNRVEIHKNTLGFIYRIGDQFVVLVPE